jgi:orotate phosphoribosyltransferase
MAVTHASDWDRDAALTTARILLEIKAVNFRPEEPYTFTSGWKSPVYIDCRKIISFPRARNRICDLAVEKIGRHIGFETIESVVGGETAGIPFGAWIADRMMAPMAYVRKKPKGFGRNAQIEGEVPVGKQTLLVEDLTTDGASKIRFANALRDAGAICDHTFVVFYYGVFPGSFEQMKAMGPEPASPVYLVGRAGGLPRAALFQRGRAKGGAQVPGGPGRLVPDAWRDRVAGGGEAEGRGGVARRQRRRCCATLRRRAAWTVRNAGP